MTSVGIELATLRLAFGLYQTELRRHKPYLDSVRAK